MADYYTQFSFIIPLEPDEVAWVQRVLSDADRAEEIDEEEAKVLMTHGPAQDFFKHIFGEKEGSHGNEWNIQSRPDDLHVWLHADEGADVDAAALFAQAYLRAFHMQQQIEFEWSTGCSKPRTDAFGGGACLVTSKRVYAETTMDILARFRKNVRGRLRNPND